MQFYNGNLAIEGYTIKVLVGYRRFRDGNATILLSTDAGLLRRALGDITGKFKDVLNSDVTPTNLILFNNIGIKEASSNQVESINSHNEVHNSELV